MILTRDQQLQEKQYNDDELESFRKEYHESNYATPLVVDSVFGMQYFQYLARKQRGE